MYTEKDIQIIGNAEDLIRNNSGKFLRGSKFPSFELASAIAEAALILGAKSVEIVNRNKWIIVAADHDWMETDRDYLFRKLIPFPDAGANSCRPELIVKVSSSSLVVRHGDHDPLIIKDGGNAAEIISHLGSLKCRAGLAFCL